MWKKTVQTDKVKSFADVRVTMVLSINGRKYIKWMFRKGKFAGHSKFLPRGTKIERYHFQNFRTSLSSYLKQLLGKFSILNAKTWRFTISKVRKYLQPSFGLFFGPAKTQKSIFRDFDCGRGRKLIPIISLSSARSLFARHATWLSSLRGVGEKRARD